MDVTRAIETFGENVERTHYDPDIDANWAKLQCAQRQVKEIKSHLEMLIQPNPALRIEKAIVTTLQPENLMLDTDFLDGSNERDFANCLALAGVELEPISPIARTLQAIADIHNEVARGERQFRQTTSALILTQLNEFLTLADDVFRERRHVENLRLDLDVAKAQLRQPQPPHALDAAERSVNAAQDAFLESQAILKGLLENAIMQLETHHNAWEVFIDSRRCYMMSGVDKATEVMSTFHPDLDNSSSFRGSTSEINFDASPTPDPVFTEAAVDVPVAHSSGLTAPVIPDTLPDTLTPVSVTVESEPRAASRLYAFLPKLFRSKPSKKSIATAVATETKAEIEITGGSEAEVIENMKAELSKLLLERNELKETLRNARSCPICSEMFNTGVRSATKLRCAHIVCIQCAILWLDSQGDKASCPTCRLPYKKKDMQKVQLDL